MVDLCQNLLTLIAVALIHALVTTLWDMRDRYSFLPQNRVVYALFAATSVVSTTILIDRLFGCLF